MIYILRKGNLRQTLLKQLALLKQLSLILCFYVNANLLWKNHQLYVYNNKLSKQYSVTDKCNIISVHN